MSYIRILDEGNLVQDHCCEVNYVGAGVAATRPSLNDRVTVTIPSGADVGGWTRDVLTTTVRLTNAGDLVAVGVATAFAAEKVRILNAAGVALRIEGREDFPKTGTAAAAASQARSYVVRLTASMWTGAAEVERDIDLYAAPSSLGFDEAGGSRAELVVDYEGWRLLMIQPTAAAPAAVPGVIFRSDAPSGVTIYEWRVGGDVVSPALHTAWTDLNGTVTPLFAIDGDGPFVPPTALAAGADSRRIRLQGQTSVALRNIDILNEADPGADTYRLRFLNNALASMAYLESSGSFFAAGAITAQGGAVTGGGFATGAGTVVDALGNVLLVNVGNIAGDDSRLIRLTGRVVGAAVRNIDIQNECAAGTDTYRLRINDNGGAQLLVVGNNAGVAEIGFLGAAAVPRQTAATPTAAEIKAGLVALGLFNA